MPSFWSLSSTPFTDAVGSPGLIRVVRSASTGIPGVTEAFRLQVRVESAVGIEREIFLYHRQTINPVDGSQGDFFRKVCGPSDIQEYPVGAPHPDADLPFYRLDTIDLTFRSAALMEETWSLIVEDLGELGRTMTLINALLSEATVEISF